MRKYFQSAGALLLAAAMLTGCSSAQPAEEPAEETAEETEAQTISSPFSAKSA